MDPQEKFHTLFICFCLIIVAIYIFVKIIPLTIKQGNRNYKEHLEQQKKHKEEEEKALLKARKIKHFFEDAVKKDGGQLLVVPCKIENLDTIDWDHEQRSSLVYFRVRLEYGYNAYVEMLQNSNFSTEETTELRKLYLDHTYGKSWEEIERLGIDPSRLIYDIEKGDDLLEGILYYPFCCPAKGSARNKFIDKI